MRLAYVRVDLGDLQDNERPSFVVSPVPFLYREGEILIPPKERTYTAQSYSELCALLRTGFKISEDMIPQAQYFKPSKTERGNGAGHIYRTVPKGAGEPEWRTKARQALLDAVDEASQSLLFGNGKVVVNGKDCSTIQALRQELETLAEDAGGKRRIKGEAYQPDYDVLVEEALQRDTYLLDYSGIPKTSKRAK